MNKNQAYAYLLLGAVVLAGVGGFMIADFNIDVETIPGTTSFATDMVITITDVSIDSEVTTNGETS